MQEQLLKKEKLLQEQENIHEKNQIKTYQQKMADLKKEEQELKDKLSKKEEKDWKDLKVETK